MRTLTVTLNHWFFDRHLESGEHVRLILHAHWRLGVKALFWPTLSFVAAWAFLGIAPFLSIFSIVALWSIASLVWWVRNFLDYYLDAWIITDQAIIDVQWYGWFHRTATKILFSDIQGVSYEVKGIAGTLLKYGTVTIEKVSSGGTVALSNVSRPREAAAAILRHMEACLHMKSLKDARHVQEILSGIVTKQVQLNELGARRTHVR